LPTGDRIRCKKLLARKLRAPVPRHRRPPPIHRLRLLLQFDTITGLDRGAGLRGEHRHIVKAGVMLVHKDEGVSVMKPGAAQTGTFEATGIKQPTGREFHAAVDGMRRHRWACVCKLSGHDQIGKKIRRYPSRASLVSAIRGASERPA